jgi:hypothetical protein
VVIAAIGNVRPTHAQHTAGLSGGGSGTHAGISRGRTQSPRSQDESIIRGSALPRQLHRLLRIEDRGDLVVSCERQGTANQIDGTTLTREQPARSWLTSAAFARWSPHNVQEVSCKRQRAAKCIDAAMLNSERFVSETKVSRSSAAPDPLGREPCSGVGHRPNPRR